MSEAETRDGVSLSNLDQPLFDGAGATKRDLVDYLDAVRDLILPELTDRPLSVIRVRIGQDPFFQKNVPKYTPSWIRTVPMWAHASKREISYALCNDRRTLLWFANQRAVEYHITLFRVDTPAHPTHLVLDLDPPPDNGFRLAARAAHLVRAALADADLVGTVKTSGAKGLHVFVPIEGATTDEVSAATRALAARAERIDPTLATTAYMLEDREGKVYLDPSRVGGVGTTVVAAYSPRARPGTPVSFPVPWSDLDSVAPGDFTVRTVPGLLVGNPWADGMPQPQRLPSDIIEEGRAIPTARVVAMHEGKRRAREQRRE